VQATTTKITIIAMMMEVTTFLSDSQLDVLGDTYLGKELSYRLTPHVRCVRCRWNSSWRTILPSQDHDAIIEKPILALDFITTVDPAAHDAAIPELLQSAKQTARLSCLWATRGQAAQATDSVSRSLEEITVETPSPRMLIPYKASAISMVRF
jgi:hypothetical protein